MISQKIKSGFTMIELLVVVGMLMLLAAALTTSISGANKRAKIQACTAEVQEMTNAILAYENYAKDGELKEMNDVVATVSTLSFILGDGENGFTGKKVPVLYKGHPDTKGNFLDPWQRPFYVTIRKGTIRPREKGNNTLGSYVMFPNYNRRPATDLEAANK